jgi:hypothetical protein
MSPAANDREAAPLRHGLASRYEVLIRLAEAIRLHPDEKDLFRTLANELHEVVEFDAFCQFDGAANWVQWYFVEPYKSKLGVWRMFLKRKRRRGGSTRTNSRSWPASRISGLVFRRFSIASRNWVSSRLMCSP